MKQFLDKDFLLSTDMAKTIYHDYAENMPILDYHCHINPQEIYEDRKFENITQVWLGGDHYKWRQMRSNGVDEKYITGDGTDREKFQAWAETMPKLIGNPLYHWSHLELRRYFGYEGYLNGDTAEEVWNLCNAKLQEDSMTVRNLIKQSNVTLICTTDDPVDSLEWHKKLAEDTTFDVQVLPAWRPDKAMNVEKPTFAAYMDQLSKFFSLFQKDEIFFFPIFFLCNISLCQTFLHQPIDCTQGYVHVFRHFPLCNIRFFQYISAYQRLSVHMIFNSFSYLCLCLYLCSFLLFFKNI